MFCTRCGKQLNDDAVVCTNCGVPVHGAFGKYANGTGFNGSAPQPQNQPQSQTKKVNGLGIAGFCLGIASILFGYYIPVLPIVGFVLSLIAQIKRKDYNSCNGFALAGLIINVVLFVLIIIAVVIVFIFFGWAFFMALIFA